MTEQLIRALTLILVTAFVLVWSANLFRVRGSGSLLYSKNEGLLLAVFTRALVLASLWAVLRYVLQPHAISWARLLMPNWLRLFGFVVGGIGVGLLHWVLVTLGRSFSMSLVVKKEQSLVTEGPYRRVRHPMYTAFSLIFLGLFLLSANWFVGTTAAIAYGAIMLIRTPQEERMLLAKFGDEYAAYVSRTGRFLPKLAA
jgi:protein-S-isoprenylcysteine O-methyltransferase Ste14